jgi:hypothetical protein
MLKGDINTLEFEHLDCKKKKSQLRKLLEFSSVGTWAGI